MNVEPTCRFCHGQMVWLCSHIPTRISTGPYKELTVETYRCKRCESSQDFDASTDKTLGYSFDIGAYRLDFHPHNQTFEIYHYPRGRMAEQIHVLRLTYLPHNLTPQTVTVKRIKTLVLFS